MSDQSERLTAQVVTVSYCLSSPPAGWASAASTESGHGLIPTTDTVSETIPRLWGISILVTSVGLRENSFGVLTIEGHQFYGRFFAEAHPAGGALTSQTFVRIDNTSQGQEAQAERFLSKAQAKKNPRKVPVLTGMAKFRYE